MTFLPNWVQRLVTVQFVVFCAFGVVNTAIHALTVVALVEWGGTGATLANTVAFFLANLFSYGVNSLVTFKVRPSFEGYLRFFSSSLVVLATTIVVSGAGEAAGVHYIPVMIMLMIMSPILSFLMVRRFAFGKRA